MGERSEERLLGHPFTRRVGDAAEERALGRWFAHWATEPREEPPIGRWFAHWATEPREEPPIGRPTTELTVEWQTSDAPPTVRAPGGPDPRRTGRSPARSGAGRPTSRDAMRGLQLFCILASRSGGLPWPHP